MALIYLDPVNGNDANSGLTFALRKKTLYAASLVAGSNSEIRIIKSPAPTVLGTCSWTDNSNTVTIPAGTVVNIENCESGWTAATNVTNTYSTTCRQGSFSLSMAIGASFTTGKAAYKAVSMDLTGYQQLSFWVRQASGTVATAGQVSIKLCSDTTGDTPVYSFDVPKLGATGQWHCFTVDLGSGMGTISSIAIYINSDLGAQTFLFDNILASKAPSAADSLSLVSLISKGTGDEPWLPIRSIVGTTLILDCGVNNTGVTNYGNYAGVTGSVTSYKRETLKTPIGSSTSDATWGTVGGGGGINQTVSGGWDETDMSTQTGDSYLDGTAGLSYGLNLQNTGLTFTKLSLIRFGTAIYFNSGYSVTSSGSFTGNDINGNTIPFGFSSNSPRFTLSVNAICNNQGSVMFSGTNSSAASQGCSWTIKNVNGNGAQVNITGFRQTYLIDNIKYNNNIMLINASESTGTFKYIQTAEGSASLSLFPSFNSTWKVLNEIRKTGGAAFGSTNTGMVLNNVTLDLTGCAVICSQAFSTGGNFSGLTVIGGTLTGTAFHTDAVVTWIGTTFGTAPNFTAGSKVGRATCQDYNGVAGDVRIFDAIGNIQTATDQRQTGTGYSWKFSPNSNTSSTYPLELELAKLPISAESITFSIYIRRTDSSSTASIIAKKGQLGLTSDVISSSTVTGSWEKVTLTVTPTVQGVLTLHMRAYGTTPVWFDTFGVQE